VGADQNLAVHSAWADAENQHDLSRHHEFLHDDIVVHQAGQEPIVGFDAYMAMMDNLYAALDGFSTTLEDQFATDDRDVCRWESTGVHAGELNGIPETRKRLTFAGVSLWEFDKRQGPPRMDISDIAALMSQLM